MAVLSRGACRIKRELKDLEESKDDTTNLISIETVNDNLLKLKGEIRGLSGTPYEGGNFILDIKIPESYPFKAARIRFVTKIWHPNICSVTGRICQNNLNYEWVPSTQLRTILLSLQGLLCDPEPDSPHDEAVAKQYQENFEMFEYTAKYWAQFYAGAPGWIDEHKEKVTSIVQLGASEEKAIRALSLCSWELSEAVDFIYS